MPVSAHSESREELAQPCCPLLASAQRAFFTQDVQGQAQKIMPPAHEMVLPHSKSSHLS